MTWRSDFDKVVVTSSFERRGWIRHSQVHAASVWGCLMMRSITCTAPT